jgi:hypothetical protein
VFVLLVPGAAVPRLELAGSPARVAPAPARAAYGCRVVLEVDFTLRRRWTSQESSTQ